jgi:hypothetical protein
MAEGFLLPRASRPDSINNPRNITYIPAIMNIALLELEQNAIFCLKSQRVYTDHTENRAK